MRRIVQLIVHVVLTISMVMVLSCGEEKITDLTGRRTGSRFRIVSPDSTQIHFNNRIVENDTFNMVDFFYVYNGGGVAVGDVNNDSLPDIFFTGNMVDDRLYLNKGNLEFEEVTKTAGIDLPGWSTGATMVDINHDGFLDIHVCRSGNYPSQKRKNLFYINEGDGTFQERAEALGLADTGYATQAAFFDYDKDGDLDLYLLNHTNTIRDPNNARPLISDGTGPANDRLYRNEEVETSKLAFTDVSQEAGIRYDGMGLGIGVADVNEDGWDDVFVTNDFIANDYLYINNQKGGFEQLSKKYLDHVSHFSMGNDMADFNNDGRIDLVTADMLPKDNFHRKKMSGPLNNDLFRYTLEQGYMPQYMRNTLQLNNGKIGNNPVSFSEIGQLAGISATDWSWAPLLADFDNDGRKDLFISNGYLRDITDLDFINYTGSQTGNLTLDSLDNILKTKAKNRPSIKLANFMFRNSGNLSFEDVSESWGLDEPSLSNGAVYADLDNDGDLDIVTNNINAPAAVYENRSELFPDSQFLNITLIGDSLNPKALGATVRLFRQGKQQMAVQSVVRGYQSSIEPRLHFGLGDIDIIDSVSVSWPDGMRTVLENQKPNGLLLIDKSKTALNNLGHSENALTKNKPAEGSPAERTTKNLTESLTIFQNLTEASGLSFERKEEDYLDFNRQFLLPHKHSRQGPGVAVADINGDGNDDFFVGGGYNYSGQFFLGTKDGRFQQRPLVKNEKEKYEEDTGILFFDYDGDGDEDLYVASGSNEFYEGSEYYQDRLYTNDGSGNFELDVEALPKSYTSSSCVRAADFDQDGDLDLFVGGRLIPLKYSLPPNSKLLRNDNGKFTDVTGKLAPSLRKPGMVTDALWTDFDNDMDADLIVVGEFMAIQFFRNEDGRLVNISGSTGLSYTSGWWNSINGGDFDNDGDTDYILGNLGLNTAFKASPEEPLTVYGLDHDRNGVLDPILTSYIDGVEYPMHSRDDLIKQIPAMKKKFPDYASYAKASFDEILTSQEKSSAYISKTFHLASGYLRNEGGGRFELIDLPIEAQVAPVFGILIADFDKDGNLDAVLSGNDYGTEVGNGQYDAMKGVFLSGNGNGGFDAVQNVATGLFLDGDHRGSAVLTTKNGLEIVFGTNTGHLKIYGTNTSENQQIPYNVPPRAFKAKIMDEAGTNTWKEFYHGSSYLSQSSRILKIPDENAVIEFYDYKGNRIKIASSSQ